MARGGCELRLSRRLLPALYSLLASVRPCIRPSAHALSFTGLLATVIRTLKGSWVHSPGKTTGDRVGGPCSVGTLPAMITQWRLPDEVCE